MLIGTKSMVVFETQNFCMDLVLIFRFLVFEINTGWLVIFETLHD